MAKRGRRRRKAKAPPVEQAPEPAADLLPEDCYCSISYEVMVEEKLNVYIKIMSTSRCARNVSESCLQNKKISIKVKTECIRWIR